MMAAHRPSSLVQVEAEAVLRLVSRPQLSRGRPMPGRRKIEQQPPRSDFFFSLYRKSPSPGAKVRRSTSTFVGSEALSFALCTALPARSHLASPPIVTPAMFLRGSVSASSSSSVAERESAVAGVGERRAIVSRSPCSSSACRCVRPGHDIAGS